MKPIFPIIKKERVIRMDPVANLKKQLELAEKMVDGNQFFLQEEYINMGFELSELVLALYEWRIKGGYDPIPSNKG
jgi:hypothetical protein